MPILSRRKTLALLSSSAIAACATPQAGAPEHTGGSGDDQFEALAAAALDQWARLNPSGATALGDHRFDGQVDTLTPIGRAERNSFRDTVLADLSTLDHATMTAGAAIDADMLANRMRRELWSERLSESWAWDPLPYNSAVGDSLYALMARDFAPLPERLNNAALRMSNLPDLLQAARANLDPERVPAIHAETYARQNPGIASIIDDMILAQADALGEQDRARLFAAATRLKRELEIHQAWIDETLVPNARGDFRIGAELYDSKLAVAFNSPMSRANIRASAEADIERIRAEMAELAGQIVTPPANERWTAQRMIAQALERAYAERPAREGVVAACEQSLARSTDFVRTHGLITLPDAPVNIILMPEFQRGIAVAYCDSPGALDRHLDTYYAVSPIPDAWSDEQTTSFLREYNTRSINELTVHEAMPGHYVQLWHSNKYHSLTRAAFYSGPFVEGWAWYAQDMMIEQGFQDNDPLAKLINLKWGLRGIANAILDQAIHVDGMSRDEAMTLMTETCFQEEREAAGKWVRAQITSAQLPTYFIGWSEHWALRREAEHRWGQSFNLKRYHDTVLSFGSPPVHHARALLFGEPIQI